MPLVAGTRLGPYEILAQIGAGGMGEVYKAMDPKLDRLVAVKVLPSSLAAAGDLLARFEREAKAVAALNHPNILGIYDFGRDGEYSYAVMELLEGEALRDRLKSGPLTARKAIDVARQMAEGLAAAHDKGIIHRDLKPENLFITREGRVKLLDFGLAKQLPTWHEATGNRSELLTDAISLGSPGATQAGMVMGTVGYMSPEQVRGESVDQRSDIFSFGVVLYELLTGRRAFKGATGMDTLHAILREDPAELGGTRSQIPPALARLVFHCLEKDPRQRFQSMRDLAYELDNLSTLSTVKGPSRRTPPPSGTWPPFGLGSAAALLVLLIAGLALSVADRLHLQLGLPAPPPRFQRLSFAPGTVEAAHFGVDGRTVYFSARINGHRPELFTLAPDGEEPRAMGIQDALLLGASPANELYFLRTPVFKAGGLFRGTLAQASAGGGAVKEIQAEVLDAAWDGQGMVAILTLTNENRVRLEYPVGRIVIEGSGNNLTLRMLRLAPDGQRLAFAVQDAQANTRIETFDRAGQRKTLYTKGTDSNGETITGLAWGPGGELWFTELQGDQTVLWALSEHHQRRLWSGPGSYQLMDVAADGHLLMTSYQSRRGVLVQHAGDAQARDLSIQSGTQVMGLSADGQKVLLLESPVVDGSTAQDRGYLRPVDGSPALSLIKCNVRCLSHDGRWVSLNLNGQALEQLDPGVTAAIRQTGLEPSAVLDPKAPKACLVLVPTGMGRPWALALPAAFEDSDRAWVLADGQRVVFVGTVKGSPQWYLVDRRGGAPQALAPPGFGIAFAGLEPLSPDGTRFILSGNARDFFIVPVPPVPGQAPRPIKGLLPGERLLGWAADGRSVFVRPELSVLPVTITRLDPATGARALVQTLALPDPAGHQQVRDVFLTPDARTFAFDFDRKLSELYLVVGVR